MEIITELRKYDLKLASEESVKSYCSKLISQFLYIHILNIKKFYDIINKITIHIKDKKLDHRPENFKELKHQIRVLFHLRNCIIDILQYKILKLFSYNIVNSLKRKNLSKYKYIYNGSLINNYFTYIDCISNLEVKINNKIDNFNPLIINKEIEYFVNHYNPKYNNQYQTLCNEIINGENINKPENPNTNLDNNFITKLVEDPDKFLRSIHNFANSSSRNMAITLYIIEIFSKMVDVYKLHDNPKNPIQKDPTTIIINVSSDTKSVNVNDNKIVLSKQN